VSLLISHDALLGSRITPPRGGDDVAALAWMVREISGIISGRGDIKHRAAATIASMAYGNSFHGARAQAQISCALRSPQR